MTSSTFDLNRRPIKARSLRGIRDFAALLARLGVTPNQVSCASMAFAALGSLCMSVCNFFPSQSRNILLMSGAMFVQLRLLCNLLDGLIAVESCCSLRYVHSLCSSIHRSNNLEAKLLRTNGEAASHVRPDHFSYPDGNTAIVTASVNNSDRSADYQPAASNALYPLRL